MRSTMMTQAGGVGELMNCSVTMPVTESNKSWPRSFFANDYLGNGNISKRQPVIRLRQIIPLRFADADCDDVEDIQRKRIDGDASHNA